MKLGIYADGFGCSLTKWSFKDYATLKSHLGLSWVEILEKNYDIVNYSKQAVSFLELYDTYRKTKHKQDINILIAPTVIRVFVKELPHIFFLNAEFVMSEIQRIERGEDYYEKNEELSILRSVYVYMTQWRDIGLETEIQHIIISECLDVDKNLFVVKGADNSTPFPGVSLESLSIGELKLIDASFTLEKLKLDQRKCFLSEENNLSLAELLLESINKQNNRVIITEHAMRTPSKSLDHYVGTIYEKS